MAKVRVALLGAPILALLVLGVFGLMPFMATCGGHDEVVTEALLACPRAVELLGKDAHPARLGVACGSTETSGGAGAASWQLPYTGSKGRGTVSFHAEKHGGDWKVFAATLEVGAQTIDLLACSGGSPGGSPGRSPGGQLVQTNADAADASFDGKVIRSTHPTILSGSTCAGRLRRERGATTAHATVTCTAGVGEAGGSAAPGEVPIYDGDGTFSMNVGDASRRDDDRSEFEDAKTSDQDTTPGCRLSSAGTTGTLTLWDASPAYEIVIGL